MNILYEDKFCKITDLCIMIYKYYFPLATSRTILFTDIQKITLESSLNVRHKWGPSTHCLNNWFHYDANRRKKEKFIAIHIKNRKIIPSLTPQDATKVFQILRALLTPSDKNISTQHNNSEINQQTKQHMNEKVEEQQQAQYKQMMKMNYNQDSQLEQKPSQIQLNIKKQELKGLK